MPDDAATAMADRDYDEAIDELLHPMLSPAAEKMSTTSSEMRSQTLSGWPSETDSLVKRCRVALGIVYFALFLCLSVVMSECRRLDPRAACRLRTSGALTCPNGHRGRGSLPESPPGRNTLLTLKHHPRALLDIMQKYRLPG